MTVETVEENTVTEVKVVIVEDHEFTRMGLKLSLEKQPGINMIGEAADGAEGVKTVLELRPQVVLMDIELPTIDGIEATKQIRAGAPDVRIIMLTSHNNDQAIFAALGAGANGYCLKSIAAQQLATVIKMVADGAAWLDPGIANRVLGAYAGGGIDAGGVQATSQKPAAKSKRESPTLSPRETEVLRLVAEGFSNQKIAERLGLGLETVKTHMRHIMEKLTVSDRTEAAVKAMKQGLV
jgi:DNA-binding NarL/FixJ family response regulator